MPYLSLNPPSYDRSTRSHNSEHSFPPMSLQIARRQNHRLAAQEPSIHVLDYVIFEDLEQMMSMSIHMHMSVPGNFLLARLQTHDSIILSLIPPTSNFISYPSQFAQAVRKINSSSSLLQSPVRQVSLKEDIHSLTYLPFPGEASLSVTFQSISLIFFDPCADSPSRISHVFLFTVLTVYAVNSGALRFSRIVRMPNFPIIDRGFRG
ncbi:unnamed protein product [Protopolystoma xenopodis]|uniref:Uncharacterized protein n=1 Tax=Protopolystoma xenopodis TaxID=117903 RepID=A0A3S5FCR9_9PLAT|nr:unnamed protein product [Protopolystoma xenopodis]